jgi:hypothetical protein
VQENCLGALMGREQNRGLSIRMIDIAW